MKNSEIALSPLKDTDVSLLKSWLNKEYILKWFKNPKSWIEEINGRNNEFSWIHHFIVMDGAKSIGFCQYYDCYDANGIEEWYDVTKHEDTFSIDYLIGDEAYLGKGYGKLIVKLLTDTIQNKESARQIVVQPDAENHSSNNVLIANGYVFDGLKKYYYKILN